MSTILIPPVQEYREQLMTVLLHMMAYECRRLEKTIPDLGLYDFFKIKDVSFLLEKIKNAHPERNIPISEQEMLLTYACFDCSNKLLISSYDEFVMDYLLDKIPDVRNNGTFQSFRKNMVEANAYCIRDTEKKFSNLPELKKLKRKLREFIIK